MLGQGRGIVCPERSRKDAVQKNAKKCSHGAKISLTPAETASLVHRGSTEHQAAQQLASFLSGTSGGKSKKKAAKTKIASCSASLAQLLVLALDFELPKAKEEAPLSAPAASPAAPFLPLSPPSSIDSPVLPPVLQVNPILRDAGDGGSVSQIGSPFCRVVKRSPRPVHCLNLLRLGLP